MNYKTHYFEGQMETFWAGIDDDKNYLDNWTTIKKIAGNKSVYTWDRDKIIAKEVKKIINSSKGNFIFIFKYGSHIPYHKNFPSDKAVWKPSAISKNKFDIPKGTEEIQAAVNAYDNSILYNVDSFFQNLIDDYENIPNNTVILYTGDHGQTLFANGKASHGGDTKDEANVPLFIIGDLGKNVDTDYKASHQNLYPTILDLIDYPKELRERTDVLSLLKARSTDSKTRFFNPLLKTKIPFD
jgi:glucan phosphoethanolaminetransferase (alkaline phosphatase superfamily)